MNIKRPLILAAGTLCALMFAAALSADDTEIFFNTSETEIRPNLLFVLDNSGSMDAMVASFTPYDPVIDYSGDYASDNIYYAIWKWERNPDGWGYYRVPIYYSIATSTLQCPDVITGLARSGHLVGYRMAYKKRGDWEDLDGGNISSETICEANSTVNLRWSRYSARDVYSANYLNWYYGVRADSYEEKTRLQVMKDVAKNLADSLTDVNIGLMAFNTDGAQRQGGSVLVPMADIDGNRDAFKLAVDALNHETKTPLAETLFGAMRYYSGLAPFLDTTPESSTIDAASGNYISPIGNACQSNNVIFLTDGAPTCDGYSSTTALCGDNKEDTDSQATMSAAVDGCTGNCMDEIAGHMQNGDIYTGLADDQFVTTYTVGFHSDASQLDQDLLIDAAEAGGGGILFGE